ncbi:serine--tRNA ligase [Candidatus Zinderia endosymbiont of Aphrophora alni]|uniref:serine--tRNA ligase n=1 Tax=Candidatus Zinderia endosymbiont of Aphrophora alni TaxID=3077951 RepID=UPI0030D282E8
MLNFKKLKKNIFEIFKILKTRNFNLKIKKIFFLEKKRKFIQIELEILQNKRNILSKKYIFYKKNKKNINSIKEKVIFINKYLKKFKLNLQNIKKKLNNILINIPNIPHNSVPINNKNIEIKKNKKFPKFKFKIKNHSKIGLKLGINTKLATKITGTKFVVMKGKIVKIYRALSQFMLDTHIKEHGYTEYYIPYIVNKNSLYSTGQLPKFKNELFKIKKKTYFKNQESLYLIPTSEVPLLNIVKNKILNFNKLPLKMVASSPCFRSEPINYGKDTKGIIRQHQFDKVEIIQITHPKKSYSTLEEMIFHIENILNKLDLPYRIMKLCSLELSFSAKKTYDIEVWLPSQKEYLEISSVSNCGTFQARRMNTKFKNKNGKLKLVHTLNGSGLAIGRTLIALLENFQEENEKFFIPPILKKYLI